MRIGVSTLSRRQWLDGEAGDGSPGLRGHLHDHGRSLGARLYAKLVGRAGDDVAPTLGCRQLR
jgi:hypothetical protein